MTSMRDICRLCMCRDDSMVSIFDEEGIAAKITWVSQLKIFEGDPLPGQICKRCSLRLDSAYYFKEQCISIDRALREMVQHQCSTTSQKEAHSPREAAGPIRNVEGEYLKHYQHQTEDNTRDDIKSQDIKRELFTRQAKEEGEEAPLGDATWARNDNTLPKYETCNDPLAVSMPPKPTPKASTKRRARTSRLSSVPVEDDTLAATGFACRFCNKTFRTKASMTGHLSVHSRKKAKTQRQDVEERTPPTNNRGVQADSSPNLYKELDIKHERPDVPEPASDFETPGEATLQSSDFKLQGDAGPAEFHMIRAGLPMSTFRSYDFNGCHVRPPGDSFPPSNPNRPSAHFPMLTTHRSDLNRPNIRIPVNKVQSSYDFNRPNISIPMEAVRNSNFNGPSARIPIKTTQFYAFNRPNVGNTMEMTRPSDFNQSIPMETAASSVSSRLNVGIPVDMYRHSDFNRAGIRIPTETAQSSISSRLNGSFPDETYQHSDFNRSSVQIPTETAQSSVSSRSNFSIPNEMYQDSNFNRTSVRIPMETAQSSVSSRSNIGIPDDMYRHSDFNRTSSSTETAQSSVSNRSNVSISYETYQDSDFSRTSMGIPTETSQSFVSSRSNVCIPDETYRDSDPLANGPTETTPAAKKRGGKTPRDRAKRRKLVFECPFCDDTFDEKAEAERHILGHLRSETDDGPPLGLDEFEPIVLNAVSARTFRCEHCGKALRTRSDLVVHLRTHSSERPFSCPECPRRFLDASFLATHLRRSHGVQDPFP